MTRIIGTLLLAGALGLVSVPEARGQMQGRQMIDVRPGIVGTYRNVSTGGIAQVYRSGRGFLFIDENGDRAWFVPTRSNRLEIVGGWWAPTVVTVGQYRPGQALLRFDSTIGSGFWLQVG